MITPMVTQCLPQLLPPKGTEFLHMSAMITPMISQWPRKDSPNDYFKDFSTDYPFEVNNAPDLYTDYANDYPNDYPMIAQMISPMVTLRIIPQNKESGSENTKHAAQASKDYQINLPLGAEWSL